MHYSKYFHRDSFFFDMWNFGELFAKKNKLQDDALDASTKIGSLSLSNSSLRKQPTFRDATPGFPLKWRLRNESRISILMTRHYADASSAADWLKPIVSQTDVGSDASLSTYMVIHAAHA